MPASAEAHDVNEGRLYVFIPVANLVTALTVMLSVHALLNVGSAVAGTLFHITTSRTAAEMLQYAVIILAFLLLATAVVVSMFMYRANANVRALGATGLKITPGWAAAYWYIPIANLFRPFAAMKEIYQASRNPQAEAWKSIESPQSIGWWWGMWLTSNFADNFLSRIPYDTGGTLELILGLTWISALATTIAALLLIKIVRGISAEQAKHTPQHI